jgi:hypothetical protein
MSASASRPIHLGFLTVRSSARGLRGGYLIVNRHARPVQFLHTTEISVGRAARALYGPEFARHILIDGLARPLTERQSIAPSLILVDDPSLLGLRESVPAPVIAVTPRRTDRLAPLPRANDSSPALSDSGWAERDAGQPIAPIHAGESQVATDPGTVPAIPSLTSTGAESPFDGGETDEPMVIDEDAEQPRLWHRFGIDALAHPDFAADLTVFERLLETMPGNFQWLEPFDRVATVLADIRDPAPLTRVA